MKGPRKRRVAVTGMGAITPLGNSFPETWQGVLEGRRNASSITLFPCEEFPTNFAYEVRNFSLETASLSPTESHLLNRAGQFMVAAGLEAMNQADWKDVKSERQRLGVCLGVGIGCSDYSWYTDIYLNEKFSDPSIRWHLKNYPATVGTILAKLADARGGVTTIHTACASSGQALGEAYEMVAYGDQEMVLAGGADSMINPFHMAGFCLLGALSRRCDDVTVASRPFDIEREGFVLGEGACALVFEEWEHAMQRGAKILGEIVGYGVTESAYRITDLHPDGVGPYEAMEMALRDANISADKLGYINAHGTSTQLNDRVEALAIHRLLQQDMDVVNARVEQSSVCRVSSTKSTTGHLISAAGAIEFALCVEALRQQILPPTQNVFTQDPTCKIALTQLIPEKASFTYALSNSVGFGGSNTALVGRRCDAID